ncbi:MAG TPA: hypothetical protein VK742_15115 [Candidatus Sulfotelmatobacter sp.]|jgi:hypothetical protein|nr:hypothetical protein [Candidatus Sulfotelmatobacter sp.]
MKSNPVQNSPEERLAIKIRAAQYAFDHLENIDGRTGLILLRNKVLNTDASVVEDADVVEVLSNYSHKDRLSISFGPLVAYYVNGDKKEAQIIDVTLLLLSRDKRARAAAFEHFRKLTNECGHVKAERLESLLDSCRESFCSDEIALWSDSAIKVFDAITDDFFINLTGVKQCIELNYELGLNQFIPKVFEPLVPSVEWIELPIPTPSKQHAEIGKIITDFVERSNSFSDACNLYYKNLGTIPLSPSFSICKLFDVWVNSKGDIQNIWPAVWAWADQTQSPLARYHAIQLFVSRPLLIPGEKFALLWSEIDQMVTSSVSKNRENRWTQEILLRSELAQHYLKYFESRRPARNGEALSRFAWWLSEQVALIFANRPKVVDWIRSSVLKNVQIRANYPWQTGAPPLEPSTLRLATLFLNSPWSLALECQILGNLNSLKYAEVDSLLRSRFEQAIFESHSCWFIPRTNPGEVLTYEFESETNVKNIVPLIEDEVEAKTFRSLIVEREKLENLGGILTELGKIAELDQQQQALTIFAFTSYAYLNEVPAEKLWKIVGDEKWNEQVFLSMDAKILQILFEGVIAVQIMGNDLLRCNFPHLLGRLAEKAHQKTERQKILFLFTILSSIAGDTVSGVERLLKGHYRNDFGQEAEFWRMQFTRIMQLSPPWAAARIRPLIGSLMSS